MKIISAFVTIILLFATNANSQNRYFSLGTKENGICFGNSRIYNGVRLNLWDKSIVYLDNKINGINICGVSRSESINGISIGILGTEHVNSNGIDIGSFAALVTNHNGIILSGIIESREKCNGLGIGLVVISASGKLNGLFASFLGIGIDSSEIEIKGVTICVMILEANKLSGLSITLVDNETKIQHGVSIAIYNKARELHGVQIGLINHAANNRRLFRTTPFLNFNFRKK